MIFPAGETITVLRPGTPTTDPLGNSITGETTEVTIAGVAIAPAQTTQVVGTGGVNSQASELYDLYMPWGSDIRITDTHVRMRGATYAIEGFPQQWYSPWTAWNAGMVVRVSRTRGLADAA